jgi:hypothetical protein
MFDSAVRSAGDKAGVFEYDGETGYFYLYMTGNIGDRKITHAIQVLVGAPDFSSDEIAIRWDVTEVYVGFFIRGQLWAAFHTETGESYGGNYSAGARPRIPAEIIASFLP